MDLLLNEQQRMLQSTIQDLLRRDFTKETLVAIDAGDVDGSHGWPALASTGLLGSLVPEEHGGAGGSFSDAGVVFEELGRGPVPGPHFSSGVFATLALRECGNDEQQAAHLPRIVTGDEVFAVAVTEPEYGWERGDVQLVAERTSGGYTLSGVKLHVPDAVHATHLLVAARTAGENVGLFIVSADAPGVACRTLRGLSTGLGEVRLDGVTVGDEALLGGGPDAWDAFERAMLQATAVLSAYQVGGLESVFQMCLEYSRTRRQFQQPIGRFQRVQDHIIDIVNHLDAARWTTYEVLWKLDTGRPAESGVHMAAALASEGYYLACNAAHDVHAGVGIVREYGLTLHTRMSRTLYHHLGSPRYHRRRVADALGLQPGLS
ncbi:MAG: acyl-CoA/acyl-ACP dehydrogenase [Chloroflexota bacterium]|nr:acyl-CoA/acyl-ACP dehydrogenase [Chloroflexota bacterium]MDE2884179.1 acyl-CoA/acyl-ACP dehydrogenase [Chloroflexota bacterium]